MSFATPTVLAPIVYSNVTPQRMAFIRSQARQKGIHFSLDQGDVIYKHFQANYVYNKGAQTLTITVTTPSWRTDTQAAVKLLLDEVVVNRNAATMEAAIPNAHTIELLPPLASYIP
jgi:hypothetical protein